MNDQTVSWFYFSWFQFQSLVNIDFEGSWTQLPQSFRSIRISLQFYFPLWRCDLGVILTLIDLSSSAFESLAQSWSVWQLPCFSSSGNTHEITQIPQPTLGKHQRYSCYSNYLWLHATKSFLRGYQRNNRSHNSQATLPIFTVTLLEIKQYHTELPIQAIRDKIVTLPILSYELSGDIIVTLPIAICASYWRYHSYTIVRG